jgi:hypothetical protein
MAESPLNFKLVIIFYLHKILFLIDISVYIFNSITKLYINCIKLLFIDGIKACKTCNLIIILW